MKTVPDMLFYHNPKCSKSRDALTLAKGAGLEPEVIEYLNAPPDLAELKRLRALLAVAAKDMIRVDEEAWKKTGLDASKASEDEIFKAVLKDPIILQRPIIVRKGKRAVIARPAEKIKEIL